ncbi:MAG TPA: hypothetical protein VES67_18900 [Vicinamibacterales bacterium]|nr:hypothetical protein [Vicinamibacterales bacterium]
MNALLVRVERLALGLTAALAVIAAVLPGGGVWAAAGVLGGAVLAAVSYWAIKHGVTGIADAILRQSGASAVPEHAAGGAATPGKRRAPRGVVMFVVRYVLLASLAYVMIARLRLPPIWLLSGASVMAMAAAIALFRGIRRT